jgi:hypothetical protein
VPTRGPVGPRVSSPVQDLGLRRRRRHAIGLQRGANRRQPALLLRLGRHRGTPRWRRLRGLVRRAQKASNTILAMLLNLVLSTSSRILDLPSVLNLEAASSLSLLDTSMDTSDRVSAAVLEYTRAKR